MKLALAVKKEDSAGVAQQVFYSAGVGTKRGARFRGGAFGVGLSRNVRECYRFLVENYEPGDRLFFFGFSRGAFTARSAAGMVRNSGILRREHANRLDDAFGLYRSRDPVQPRAAPRRPCSGARFSHEHADPLHRRVGHGGRARHPGPRPPPRHRELINRRWGFHDTALSRTVDLAYQALAIDEERGPFEPAMWHQQRAAPAIRRSSRSGSPAPTRTSAAVRPTRRSPRSPSCGSPTRPRPPASTSMRVLLANRAPAGDTNEREEGRYIAPSAMGPIHPSRTGSTRLRRHGATRAGAVPGRWTPTVTEVAFGQAIASSAPTAWAPGLRPRGLTGFLRRTRDKVVDGPHDRGPPRPVGRGSRRWP